MAYIESIPTYENNIKNHCWERDEICFEFYSKNLIERLLDLPYWCNGIEIEARQERDSRYYPITCLIPRYIYKTTISGHFFYWNIMEVLKLIVEEVERRRSEVKISFRYRKFWSVEWNKEGDSREEVFGLTLHNLKDYDKAKRYIRDRLGITSPKDLMEKARDYERQAKSFRDRCIAAQEVPITPSIMYDINHNKEVVKLDMKANHYREVARDREKRLEELNNFKKQREVTSQRRDNGR